MKKIAVMVNQAPPSTCNKPLRVDALHSILTRKVNSKEGISNNGNHARQWREGVLTCSDDGDSLLSIRMPGIL